ncbi:MAG: hypothetical protein IAE78_24640 [Myxococcus sp.]|nr:hypothetical protein [Myxococcus sp.]
MTVLSVALAIALSGAPGSRVFIASGAKSKGAAEKLKASLAVPSALKLARGYPRLVESKSLAGLNPGFFLVVLGVCDDATPAQQAHGNALAAVIQRSQRGAYAKPVGPQPEACPLWIEPVGEPPAGLQSLLARPDDPKLLLEVASAMHAQGELVGAAVLLRRAQARGATDAATLELSRTVEFILEDAPFRLPP